MEVSVVDHANDQLASLTKWLLSKVSAKLVVMATEYLKTNNSVKGSQTVLLISTEMPMDNADLVHNTKESTLREVVA